MPKSKIMKVGTLTKEQLLKMDRAARRQAEIDADPHKGFKSMHSTHKSKKTYNRKVKHKGRDF